MEKTKSKDVNKVRCPVCGASPGVTSGRISEHPNKTGKVCYGSMMPFVSDGKGTVYPGELVFPSRALY